MPGNSASALGSIFRNQQPIQRIRGSSSVPWKHFDRWMETFWRGDEIRGLYGYPTATFQPPIGLFRTWSWRSPTTSALYFRFVWRLQLLGPARVSLKQQRVRRNQQTSELKQRSLLQRSRARRAASEIRILRRKRPYPTAPSADSTPSVRWLPGRPVPFPETS